MFSKLRPSWPSLFYILHLEPFFFVWSRQIPRRKILESQEHCPQILYHAHVYHNDRQAPQLLSTAIFNCLISGTEFFFTHKMIMIRPPFFFTFSIPAPREIIQVGLRLAIFWPQLHECYNNRYVWYDFW